MDTHFMPKIDSSNPLFALASDLVNHTSRHIFLTGKAGTGKTTFLKHIRENCPKQMAVVAPTGVAAINAGGVTIHSFFQLPLSPFIPETKGFSGGSKDETTNKHTLLSRLRLNSERRKVLQELELLVIDEISMVRADVLDAIDLVLRHVRYRHTERFGGVQVLFIGDMFQLPPVVKEQEWRLLSEYYNSPYFFDSQVLKDNSPVYIEFTRIYRQTEEKFIALLNKVRNNEMDVDSLTALHSRYIPDFFGGASGGHILLTTHNDKAKTINEEELEKLQEKFFTYNAEIDGEFPPTAFPAEKVLQLKVGAQVMFIKNDTDKSKRFFNGKIGVVAELNEEKIVVQCKDESAAIEVKKEKWNNIRYSLNRSTRNLEEDILGSFSQYPLRLAWAITIHKSQGLTFEKAVIDAGNAFAPGQVYVALSRCTNLEGMVLHSRISQHAFYTDERIVRFAKAAREIEWLQQELLTSKKAYQEKLLTSLFDFSKAISSFKELQAYLLEHRSSFNTEAFSWSDVMMNRLSSLQITAERFHLQLKRLFQLTERAEDNGELQTRIKAAANYFTPEVISVTEAILQSPAVTDSSIHAKEFNENLRSVFAQLSLLTFLLGGVNGNFDMETFHRRKKTFVVPPFGVNAYAGANEPKAELAHPGLFYQLKKLRDSICSKKNLPIYIVAGSKTLEEMANYLPQTLEELEQISGFGKTKVGTYGSQFLSVIEEYCKQNSLPSNMADKPSKRKRKEGKEPKVDTKAETFRLYQEGNSVEKIAKLRVLTIQTIEGHLAHYVQTGQMKIDELVSREKLVLIEPLVKDFSGKSIIAIKEKLGTNVSFGEIRLVLAWAEYQKSSAHINH
ncbi:MAG: helix-turn-helix domain-containing protein [Flavisolibacter sp.]